MLVSRMHDGGSVDSASRYSGDDWIRNVGSRNELPSYSRIDRSDRVARAPIAYRAQATQYP